MVLGFVWCARFSLDPDGVERTLSERRFLVRLHSIGADKFNMTEIGNVYQRACGGNTGTLVRCGSSYLGHVINWQTDPTGGNITLNPAAQASYGLLSTKFLHWTNRAFEAGVSDDLTP
jgi:hypothetical protein